MLLVFACFNLSRGWIVQGLTRLMWSHLCPAGLTALVYVGETGELAVEARERLQWRVKDAIRGYQRQSVRFFAAGLLAHLPYCLLLGGLAYSQLGVPTPRTR